MTSPIEVQRLAARALVLRLNAVSGFAHLAQVGLLYPLVTLWLDARGVGATQIGLIGSFLWLGVLLGNLFTPLWQSRLSARALVMVSCVLTAVTSLAMSVAPPQVLPWGALAFALGLAIGIRWIANESWLYSAVDHAQRGRVVGVHETVIGVGQTAGAALLTLVGVALAYGFYLGAVFAALAAIPLWGAAVQQAPAADQKAVRSSMSRMAAATLMRLVRGASSSSVYRIALLSGLVDGVLFGMLPVYLTREGFDSRMAALALTVFGVAGILTQTPLGVACDRLGLKRCVRYAAVIGVAGVLVLGAAHYFRGSDAAASAVSVWLLWLAVVLLGVVAPCTLTLAIVAATESAAKRACSMAQALSETSILFCVGSAIGPVLAGWSMDAAGTASYAWLALVIVAGFGALGPDRSAKATAAPLQS